MSQAQAATSASASVSNGTRLKKRMRTSNDEDELSTATRSEKYWFEEGNVILHVPDTLFRVHRGVLVRHSTAIDEMFPVPQPDEKVYQNTVLEGSPVVHFRDDKVEDWERMLGVIYDRDASYKGKDKHSVEVSISLIRLGKKYRFDRIFDDVMQRLHEMIPTTLERWAGFPEEFQNSMSPVFKLTKAVLEVGNETLLPTLLFFCSVFTTEMNQIFQLCTATGIPAPTAHKLAIVREKVTVAYAQFPFKWVFSSENRQHVCQQPAVCQLAKQKYLQRFIATMKPCNAFKSGKSLVANSRLAKICTDCKADVIAAQEANRTELWDQIPSFFDLPPWADLQSP